MLNKHILVTGAHRSGSTWVGKTIAAHPKTRYVHEPFNPDTPPYYTWHPKYQYIHAQTASAEEQKEIEEELNKIFATPLYYAMISAANEKPVLRSPEVFLKSLISRSFYRKRVVMKDPISLLSAEWISEKFCNLKMIVVVRGPLAFAGSLKKAEWDFDFTNLQQQRSLMDKVLSKFSEQVDQACEFNGGYDFIDRVILAWNIFHFVIANYKKRHPDWLFVRHEDLAHDPFGGFNAIFHYLDLSISESVLRFIGQNTSHGLPTEATTYRFQPRDSKATLNTWQRRLNLNEIHRIQDGTQEIRSLFYDS